MKNNQKYQTQKLLLKLTKHQIPNKQLHKKMILVV